MRSGDGVRLANRLSCVGRPVGGDAADEALNLIMAG
jgi:hypothetical protein